MAVAISAETLTDAWLADLEYLCEHGEQLNLVTTIANRDPELAVRRVIENLDGWLFRKGLQRVETVANTIFPAAYLRGAADRHQFYARYLVLLPRLRRQKGNGRGTYFGRLIQYPASADVHRGPTLNQIEVLIDKLQKQLQARGSKRFTYQAQIFIPGRDDKVTMSFPCLSFVSFQLDGRRLCLTAMYRNHYYFQRALGNFIGLARLLRFVAEAADLETGSLTIHACHAEVDVLGKRDINLLIRLCRQQTDDDLAA
jgi:thymidylate synthase